MTEEQLSPNLKRSFDYSWEGYLTHQRVFNHEGSLFRQEYKYDRTGNLVQKVDSVFGMDRFNYDPIGRITGQTDIDHPLINPLWQHIKDQELGPDEEPVWLGVNVSEKKKCQISNELALYPSIDILAKNA